MDPKPLNDAQVRLLGSLIEKQVTTPANYPMTPNAVKVACNQKSNRDPVVEYDDDKVFDTLKSLERLGYVESGLLDLTQTVKYRHRLAQALGLSRAELALLCELFNRGPQTPGELRARCERLHPFADREELERCLEGLADRGMLTRLERQPGTKEQRWAHLLAGPPRVPASTKPPVAAPGDLEARVALLEDQVKQLQERLSRLG